MRTQLRLLRLGLLASVLGATSDYLPSLGLAIYPMGVLGNVAFAVITTWAVTRHRLMNLRLVLRRGFAYVLLSAGLMSVYGVTVGIVYFASRDMSAWAIGFAAAGAILVTGLFIQPYYLRLQSLIDRFFFREKVDRLSALIQLNGDLRDTMEFSSMVARLATRLRGAIQADWVAVMLPNRLEEVLSLAYDTRGPRETTDIIADGILAKWLTDRRGPARASERLSDPFLQAMSPSETAGIEAMDPQIIAPLIGDDRLTGMICIGPRITGIDYADEDIDFISSVASQSAMAVDNARLVSNEVSRLRELERLESLKSILLQTVSHELKSPLTAIKLSAEMIEHVIEGRGTVEQRERLLTTLRHGIERLERLTGESLDYAAMQSAQLELERELMLLVDPVKDAATLLTPAIEGRRQTLEIVADEDMSMLPFDRQRIERVISNLISNANKYSPEGTRITARVFKELGNQVVTVTDEGPGIAEDEQEEIFSPYYRSKLVDGTSVRGSGLGLSIARYLVELHGGTLTVTSKVGHGSTFRLELPGPDQPRARAGQATLPVPAERPVARRRPGTASRPNPSHSSYEFGPDHDKGARAAG
jgi:signal transduction histidine kinase